MEILLNRLQQIFSYLIINFSAPLTKNSRKSNISFNKEWTLDCIIKMIKIILQLHDCIYLTHIAYYYCTSWETLKLEWSTHTNSQKKIGQLLTARPLQFTCQFSHVSVTKNKAHAAENRSDLFIDDK